MESGNMSLIFRMLLEINTKYQYCNCNSLGTAELENIVNESGNLSSKWLQNCFTTKNPAEQGITLVLALTENYLKNSEKKYACRVHGGVLPGLYRFLYLMRC